MKRFVYPAVLLGLCLVMLWTHLQMFADIRSNWTIGAVISTGIFFYVALVRDAPATELAFAFPMDISLAGIWISITSSILILGATAAANYWPDHSGLKALFVFVDGVVLLAALCKAYCWAWPLGSAASRT